MSREQTILIETRPGATGAALMVDGRLEDLMLDTGDPLGLGAVCLAKVDRLVPAMGGAFLRLTAQATGFLREARGVREGQVLPVQVNGQAEPGKALPVTARVLFKERLLILTPGAPGINVSRLIREADERARLEALAVDLTAARALDPGCGVILRSAALGAEGGALARDLDRAMAGLAALATATPGLVLPAPDAARFALREWEGAVEQGAGVFDHFGIPEELDRLRQVEVPLRSGGAMAIESTRAMVAVDVNTSAEFGGGSAITANIEAARELPRQLRLRGLGGQIVVDFAPLKKTERKRIEDTLKSAFARDPVETTLAGWTPMGNFEIQRKRERRPLG